MARFFGTPPGVHVGELFIDRRELHDRFVHLPTQPGISGTKLEGADSIVLSGGYVDDEDHGDYLIYTGHGGRNPSGSRQIKDQTFEASGNAGLVTSRVAGLPVRVIRGHQHKSPYSPPRGYQYAGLFVVTECWQELGRDSFLVCRFRLDRLPEQAELITRELPEQDPAFTTSTVTRRVRDSVISRKVKHLYDDHCQICETQIQAINGRTYSEGAHVRPIGRPHLGADQLDNLLCLCPNHHTQLDVGGMVILDDYSVALTSDLHAFAELRFRGKHRVSIENTRYQRELWS